MPSVRHADPFNAVLLESESLNVSLEQQNLIKLVLEKSCSDSRSAAKAYAAIWRILTSVPAEPPVVSSLSPATVALGSPSFDVHVTGTGFAQDSVIVFAGVDEPTTFVNETDVFTGVNMDVWAVAAVVPVYVRNADGVMSDPVNFEFTEAAGGAALSAGDAGQKLVAKNKLEEEQKRREHAEMLAIVQAQQGRRI